MSRRVVKPWGYEEIWAETRAYVGKILVVKKGRRLSLQYHRVKMETLYIERGRVRCLSGPDPAHLRESLLQAGDTLHVPPGLHHRFEAVEEARIFEVSTPELTDVVRVADDFGREGSSTG
ncbi:MAG: cupin domain-containing protein [Acidobacteriota bacterium]